MITLEINNVLTKIVGDLPDEVLAQIQDTCSYSIKGAEHSVYGAETYCPFCKKMTYQLSAQDYIKYGDLLNDCYTRRKCPTHGLVIPVSLWDGRKMLLDRRNMSIATGVVGRIVNIFKEHNVIFKIQDCRYAPFTRHMAWYGPEPRYYQKEAAELLVKNSRGIIHAGTGTGKTLMMGYIASLLGTNTLVIAHTTSVFNQLHDALSDYLRTPIGRIGDGHADIQKITIAMPPSLTESVKVLKNKMVKGVWRKVPENQLVIKRAYSDFLVNIESLLVDECFPGRTRVLTEKGYMCISKIVNEKTPVKVWSFNGKDFELKPIVRYMKRTTTNDLVCITLEGNKQIKCTPNHKIYVLQDRKITKVRADKLNTDMEIIARPRTSTSIPEQSKLLPKYNTKKIVAITTSPIKAPTNVYNLEVADNHNYIVDHNVLVSNCHHISSDTVQLISNNCVNAFYRVAVSATPYRDDGTDILIEAASGKVQYRYTCTRAINDGYLAKPIIYIVNYKQKRLPKMITKTKIDKITGAAKEETKKLTYKDAYDEVITNNRERNMLIEDLIRKQYAQGKTVLCLVRYIEHGHNLLNLLKDLGKDVRYVNGELDSKLLMQTLDDLDKKKVRVVIGTSVFNEGVDVKHLDCVINATAGDSSVNAMQIVGRALRKVPGKEQVEIFDIADYGVRWFTNHSANRKKMYHTEPGFTIKEM